MVQSLKKILEEKKCFKLICGAGNENLQEVERLVALYAKAGCRFFDLSSSEEVLQAAQKGLDFAIPKSEQVGYHFCVSIGTKGDQHVCKARINPEKCKRCGKCVEVCPQEAIKDAKMQRCKDAKPEETRKYGGSEAYGKNYASMHLCVFASNCIGCLRCKSVCNHGAIEIYSEDKPIQLFTSSPIHLSCIEFHTSGENEAEIDEAWDYLCENFDGMLSICIGRLKLGSEKILSLLKKLVEKRKPYTTIIQADGSPMSGGEDDYKTTLQAVAMGELVQSLNLPVYLLLSGGTNSKTAELAKRCAVDINGVGIGSYARKIVKEYIVREDFFDNKEVFNEAIKIAQSLIQSASR